MALLDSTGNPVAVNVAAVDEKQERCLSANYYFSEPLNSVVSMWNEYYKLDGIRDWLKKWGECSNVSEKVQLVDFVVHFVSLNTIQVYEKWEYFHCKSIISQLDNVAEKYIVDTAKIVPFIKEGPLAFKNVLTGKFHFAIVPGTEEARGAETELRLLSDLASVRTIWDKYYGHGRFFEFEGGLSDLYDKHGETWIQGLSDPSRKNFNLMEKIVGFVHEVTKLKYGPTRVNPPLIKNYLNIINQMDDQLHHNGTIETIHQALEDQSRTLTFNR